MAVQPAFLVYPRLMAALREIGFEPNDMEQSIGSFYMGADDFIADFFDAAEAGVGPEGVLVFALFKPDMAEVMREDIAPLGATEDQMLALVADWNRRRLANAAIDAQEG